MSSSLNRFLVNSKLKRFASLCGAATEEEVHGIVHEIGKRSSARAPKGATGNLQSSMKAEADTQDGNVQGRVVFGSKGGMVYVVVQHEHTDFEHPGGGEAKFLERTVNEMTPDLKAQLAATLKSRVLGGD